MRQTLEALLLQSIPFLLPVALTLAAAALGVLVKNLHQKGTSSHGWEVLACAAEVALAIVRDLNVTLRPQLEADGPLTAEEGQKLKETALERMRAVLGEAGLHQLEKALGIVAGGAGVYLSGLIEGAVGRAKVELPGAPTAVAVMPGVAAPLVPPAPGK